MKHKLLLIVMIIALITADSTAQHVRVQMNFPIGVAVNPPGPPPFAGAIWIGPEWRWNRGNYVCVPGYWSKPRHHRKYWKAGHWKYTKRGYVWVPGRWK
jgi:hypothetical protein